MSSCYLFKLENDAIVDATYIGGPARFINHSCEVCMLLPAIPLPSPALT